MSWNDLKENGQVTLDFEWFWVNEKLERIVMGLDTGFPGWFDCWLVNQFNPRLIEMEITVFMFLQRNSQCTQNNLCTLHYFWMWVRHFSKKKKKKKEHPVCSELFRKTICFSCYHLGKKGFVVGWNQVTTSGVHFQYFSTQSRLYSYNLG